MSNAEPTLRQVVVELAQYVIETYAPDLEVVAASRDDVLKPENTLIVEVDERPLRRYQATIRDLIVQTLSESKSIRAAGRTLGIPYSSLRDKMTQLGISVRYL